LGCQVSTSHFRHGKNEVVQDIEALAFETEQFVSNAYSQYYYIPNSVVPKRERPQWRFTVLRFFGPSLTSRRFVPEYALVRN